MTKRHLHLHVISEDRVSPGLKTKKHYNSFRPDLGFLIPLSEVQGWLEREETIYERLDVSSGTFIFAVFSVFRAVTLVD